MQCREPHAPKLGNLPRNACRSTACKKDAAKVPGKPVAYKYGLQEGCRKGTWKAGGLQVRAARRMPVPGKPVAYKYGLL